MSEAEACARLTALVQPHCCRRLGPSVHPSPPLCREVVVPVELSRPQADAYRTVLARSYEVLADPKPPR